MERRFLVKIVLSLAFLFLVFLSLNKALISSYESPPSRPDEHTDSDFEWLAPTPAATSPSKPDAQASETEPTPAVEEQEDIFDVVRRHTRHVRGSRPKYLVLVLTRDAESWGKNDDEPARTFADFLTLLTTTGLDFADISLGVLTSAEEEYELYRNSTGDLRFANTHIFLHRGYMSGDCDRDHRHDARCQSGRRGEIAKLRNYLMLRSLRDEPHIFWLDADVYELHSPHIFQAMLAHSERADVGLITSRCEQGRTYDYDRNAWAGWRAQPTPEDDEPGKHGQFKQVAALIKGTSDEDLVKLDAVGATLLYIRAGLIHQGLTFSDSYAVGGTWTEPSWDGIESEGLCYRARGLADGGCYVLGGKWYVRHTDS